MRTAHPTHYHFFAGLARELFMHNLQNNKMVVYFVRATLNDTVGRNAPTGNSH
jgi:hypothetical protein